MGGPWDDYASPAAPQQAPAAPAGAPPAGPWGDYGQAAHPPAPTPTYSGSILPFTRYSDGSVGFDSNAGILGSIKRAVTLPGDVATGQVDPMSPEGIARSAEMATLASPVNPGVQAGDRALPGALTAFKPGKFTPPTADALHDAASAGYDAARDMGVQYSSPAVAQMAQSVQANLNAKGILPEFAPKTHSVLDQLQAVPAEGPNTVPFGSLDAARKAFGFAAKDFTNPTEQLAAKSGQSAIDDFVTGADPQNVVAGPAAAAADAVTAARSNAAAGFRSDRINGVEDAAGLRASAANSGANSGNSIRQRVASLLLSPKQSAGYNPEELDALRQVTEGSTVRNTARTLGNLLGGGGGMHGAMTGVTGAIAGNEAGGPMGAIIGAGLPVVGWGAKALDNNLTAKSLTGADELVRSRSALAEAMKAQVPPVLDQEAKRSALARALLMTHPDQAPAKPVWAPQPGSI